MSGFVIPKAEGQNEPASMFTKEDMEAWVKEGDTINSEICALLVGKPKTGKSGVALDSRTAEEKAQGKKIIVIELNSDNGCKLNKKVHHANDPNIIVLDPREFSVNVETGDWSFDYIKTMGKIKALLIWIKENKAKLNLKTIVFDGADVFLSEICEGQMRIDENIDVAGGVQQRYWKKRNNYFYDVMNMLFTIDVDKYIITHFKMNETTQKEEYSIQKNFPDKVHQIVEFRKEGPKFYAKLVDDRRELKGELFNKDVLISEVTDDGNTKWYGYKL